MTAAANSTTSAMNNRRVMTRPGLPWPSGMPQHADQQVIGLGGQRLVETAQPPQLTLAHSGPSSA